MGTLGKAKTLQGAVATALVWMYIYTGMGMQENPSPEGSDPYVRIFVSLGLICFYGITFAIPAILGKQSIRSTLSIILVVSLGGCSLLEALQPSILLEAYAPYALNLFLGMCLGFSYAQLGSFLFLLSGRAAAISLVAAMCAAALGNLLLDAINLPVEGFILKGILALAILFFLQVPLEEEKRIKPAAMFSECSETRPLFSELFLVSILYGFMVMFSSVAVSDGKASSLTLGVSYLIPAVTLLLLALLFGKRIDFLTVRGIVLPLATVAIVPLTVLPLADYIPPLVAILALFQILEASSSLSLAESAREHELPPISSFVLLRIVGTVGLLAGRVICLLTLSVPFENLDFTFRAVVAGIIVVLIIWRTFISPAPVAGRSDHFAGMWPRRTAAQQHDANWQVKRDDQLSALAAEHTLSKRETEVFLLLAKGRNAEYIGKLLYISENTVRSHIQRIYRKLDTHSQQELLDLIEKYAR